MIILLFGAPGSGKGTQSVYLKDWLGYRAVSTGELLRAEASSGSKLGQELAAVLAAGQYADDDLVNRIVENQLDRLNGSGLILDGYPRTVQQAQFLDLALRSRELRRPSVIHLDVPCEVLVERLSSRWSCPRCGRAFSLLQQKPKIAGVCDGCGCKLLRRADDEPDVIGSRLEAYHRLTGSVLDHYRNGQYLRVDGNQPPEDVFGVIQSVLGSH